MSQWRTKRGLHVLKTLTTSHACSFDLMICNHYVCFFLFVCFNFKEKRMFQQAVEFAQLPCLFHPGNSRHGSQREPAKFLSHCYGACIITAPFIQRPCISIASLTQWPCKITSNFVQGAYKITAFFTHSAKPLTPFDVRILLPLWHRKHFTPGPCTIPAPFHITTKISTTSTLLRYILTSIFFSFFFPLILQLVKLSPASYWGIAKSEPYSLESCRNCHFLTNDIQETFGSWGHKLLKLTWWNSFPALLDVQLQPEVCIVYFMLHGWRHMFL